MIISWQHYFIICTTYSVRCLFLLGMGLIIWTMPAFALPNNSEIKLAYSASITDNSQNKWQLLPNKSWIYDSQLGNSCFLPNSINIPETYNQQLQISVSIPSTKTIEKVANKERSFSGNVSWYGIPFHGKKTASGQIFDMNKLTCAHLTLPFGTKVLVENPKTGQTVVVEVTDRGPYAKGRIMDLSREAARQLGTLLGGIAYVNCLIIN